MNVRSTSSKLLMAATISVALAGCSTADKNKPPPPKPAPVAAPAPPPKVEVKTPAPAPTYVLKDVLFDTNKAILKPTATAKLDEVVDGLNSQPGVDYEVTGHTDSTGTKSYNQGLSERRAKAVHGYLVGNGVDGGRLSMRGFGETQPRSSNATREGRAQNRRVEVRPK